jgi:beta-barrel assembly-enhancing protease
MKKIPLVFLLLLACSGSRVGTLSFVSLDEETSLGREIAIQTPMLLPVIRNQEITQFYNQLVREIAAKSDWSGLTYTVFLVNSPEVNHFSLPGGEIYLYRGLLETAESAGEMAAVLAHEIAHIGRRDAINRLSAKYSYAFAAQSVIGQNPELAAHILQNLYNQETILDYPAKAEFLADALAVKYVWKANFDPNGLLTLMEKIQTLGKKGPPAIALLRSTHPSAADRIVNIRKELTSVPHHDGLRLDLAEFGKIHEQLSRLPR